jgi:DNA-binding transcriptional ArsR family regulator
MVQYASPQLDAAFAALADATRRGVLEQLGRSDASISELADRFQMTLTGMKKHVGVLEAAGLVRTEKIGRVRNCRLGPHRLAEVDGWLTRYRRMWEERFAALDGVLEELQQGEQSDEHCIT